MYDIIFCIIFCSERQPVAPKEQIYYDLIRN